MTKQRRGKTKQKVQSFLICILLLAVIVAGIRGADHLVNSRQQSTETESVSGEAQIKFEKEPDDSASLEEKEDWVYRQLINAGYSPAGVCGIMGNIYAESEFRVDYYAENGAYGLFQWTNDGERKGSYFQWAHDHDMEDNSMTAQLKFAIYELEGGDSIASRLQDYLKTADDPEAAAKEFAAGFERCVDFSRYPSGPTYDGSLYPEFQGFHYQNYEERISAAEAYYERYH